MNTITVKATGSDGRVVLFEQDKAHPGGECYIVADGKTHEVAHTSAVRGLIGRGALEEVTAAKGAKTK